MTSHASTTLRGAPRDAARARIQFRNHACALVASMSVRGRSKKCWCRGDAPKMRGDVGLTVSGGRRVLGRVRGGGNGRGSGEGRGRARAWVGVRARSVSLGDQIVSPGDWWRRSLRRRQGGAVDVGAPLVQRTTATSSFSCGQNHLPAKPRPAGGSEWPSADLGTDTSGAAGWAHRPFAGDGSLLTFEALFSHAGESSRFWDANLIGD
jgi:hypothetical protein